MADTLNGFIKSNHHSAIHLRELPIENPTDLEWISYLQHSGDNWLVITGDQRIRRNKAEAYAFRRAQLKGVVLASAYQKTPMNRCCAAIVYQWPNLLDTIERFDPPFMFEMSINFTGKFRQLTI